MTSPSTTIDADHMATYNGDFGILRKTFIDFFHHLPFYGLACVCSDDEQARSIIPDLRTPVVTYGFDEKADVRAYAIEQKAGTMHFEVALHGDNQLDVELNLPGRHNVLNSLAAIAIGHELGVAGETIIHALRKFQGISRRLQIHGEALLGQARVLLIDDYGHHPREIDAAIEAIRHGWLNRRLVVAFQPHRYSRTRDLFEDFAKSLSNITNLVLLEVYPAGEQVIAGADGRTLASAIRARGQTNPVFVESIEELIAVLPDVVRDDDILLLLGAGSIGAAANELLRQAKAEGSVVTPIKRTGGEC